MKRGGVEGVAVPLEELIRVPYHERYVIVDNVAEGEHRARRAFRKARNSVKFDVRKMLKERELLGAHDEVRLRLRAQRLLFGHQVLEDDFPELRTADGREEGLLDRKAIAREAGTEASHGDDDAQARRRRRSRTGRDDGRHERGREVARVRDVYDLHAVDARDIVHASDDERDKFVAADTLLEGEQPLHLVATVSADEVESLGDTERAERGLDDRARQV